MSTYTYNRTAPRLLYDFCHYNVDANFAHIFAAEPTKTPCEHVFIKNNDRSVLPTLEDEKPKKDCKWAIALTCQRCRLHFDFTISFEHAQDPCTAHRDAPLHHFSYIDQQLAEYESYPRFYQFRCSNLRCKAILGVTIRQPVVPPSDVAFLSTTAHVRFKEFMVAPGKNKANQEGPMQVLDQYIRNSLVANAAKARRIPAVNASFQAALGNEMIDLLIRLGFSFRKEKSEQGDGDGWDSPKPAPHDKRALDWDKARRVLEDAHQELTILIAERFPAAFLPPPSLRDLVHILGCLDYHSVPLLRRSLITDHPRAFRILGAVPDFSDDLISWCYDEQTGADLDRRPLYFKALKVIAWERNSDVLNLKTATLESRGEATQDVIDAAFTALGIDPSHGMQLADAILLSRYKGRYPDSGPSQKDEMRRALLLLGRFRGSHQLADAAQDNLDTVDQALVYLGVDRSTDHEFVWAAKIAKDGADPDAKLKNRKAVEIIQNETNSTLLASRLRDEDSFSGAQWQQPETTIEEALGVLGYVLAEEQTLQDLAPTLGSSFLNCGNEPIARKIEIADALDRINKELNDDIIGSVAANLRDSATIVAVSIPMEDPRGLRNIGNTCYLNSLLQLLYTIKPIREFAQESATIATQDGASQMNGVHPDESSSQSKRGKALQLAIELGKLFDALSTTRENPVEIDKRLAEVSLELDSQVTEESKNEKRRRSTIGSIARPSFSPTLETPVEGQQIMTVQSPVEIEMTESPIALSAPDKNEDTETVMSGTTHAVENPLNDVVQRSPPVTDKNVMQVDNSDNTANDEGSKVAAGPAKVSEADWNPAYSKDAAEDWSDKANTRSEPAVADAPANPTSTEQDQVRKIERWAQQNDMREVLANAYYQLGRASKLQSRTSRNSSHGALEQLIKGKQRTHKIDSSGRRTVLQTQPSTALYVASKAHLKHTHAVIEDSYGYQPVELEGQPMHLLFTLDDLPPILQFEITTSGEWNAELKTFDVGVPLQVVEEKVCMDRYLDNEDMIRRRRVYCDNMRRLEKLYAREALLKTSPLDMRNDQLLANASDYLEQVLEHTAASESLLPENAAGLAPALRSIGQGLDSETSLVHDTIDKIETEQKQMFADNRQLAYRLHAVCLHHGQRATSGHYSIYIFDSDRDTWYYYNDESVTRVLDTQPIFDPSKLAGNIKPAFLVYVLEENYKDLVQTVCRNPETATPKPEDPPPYEEASRSPPPIYDDKGYVLERCQFQKARHVEWSDLIDVRARSDHEPYMSTAASVAPVAPHAPLAAAPPAEEVDPALVAVVHAYFRELRDA